MIRKSKPEEIAPYLKDASNFYGGCASAVLIPQTVEEMIEFLKSNRERVVIAGAGTGVNASRIPDSGVILSVEALDQIGDVEDNSIWVGPAIRLSDLESRLEATPWFYPPNPTEMLAFIGGTVATNASGPRSYKYGMTRHHILELDLALVGGRTLKVKRGQTVDSPLVCDDESSINFPAVTYQSPRFKNAAGYFIQPGMDWIDLFIGSDGTLAITTRIKLKLTRRPADFLSGVLFFDSEEICWRLIQAVRNVDSSLISPCSLEYFDRFSITRLREKYSSIPERAQAALFFEQDIISNKDYDSVLEAWYELLEKQEVMLDDSWFADSSKDQKKFHEFRHAIPLLINEENSRSGRVKVGTDMAVSDAHFMDMMHFYRTALNESGLDYVVFGHIGDNHLHINLLPEPGAMETAKQTYQRLVDQILKWGGTVSAEHGIGKLKKSYFHQMVGEKALEEMKQIKSLFDPEWRLGAGNIL